MAAYNNVYGALSKAIGESFSGLSEGALQGEDVRHKRAQEALQQAYLQQANQQLGNTQQYQQGMLNWRLMQAAEQARRDQATNEYRQGQLGQGRERNAIGWANYDRGLAKDAETAEEKDRAATERERKNQAGEADKAKGRELQAKGLEIAQQKANQIGQRLQAMTSGKAGTNYSPADRARLAELNSRYKIASRYMGLVANAQSLGQTLPGMPSLQELRAEMDAIGTEMNQFSTSFQAPAAGGGPAQQGGFKSIDEARKALGL